MNFLKDLLNHFLVSNTFQIGAALAYYTVFSFLPVIMLGISIFGWVYGEDAVSGDLYHQLQNYVGAEAAQQIQNLVRNHHLQHNNWITGAIGLFTMILSASGLITQLHSALNNIWNIQTKGGNGVLRYVRKHVVAFVILLVLFIAIFVSTVIHLLLVHKAGEGTSDTLWLYFAEHFISFLLMAGMCAIIFKFLSDAVVRTKVVIAAGLFTATLFLVGKIGIGQYVVHSHLNSTFGAASVLAVMMVWVYYSAQILFLGASFAEVLSDKLNAHIQPKPHAVKIRQVET